MPAKAEAELRKKLEMAPNKLDALVQELIEANLDLQGFAQKHDDRVSALVNQLADELLAQGLIPDWREAT
jgi:hypothetical protein